MTTPLSSLSGRIAFIGGGNMASAIIGGLIKQGLPASQIDVVEPFAEARDRLRQAFGIEASAAPGPGLTGASLVVWAVKPQTFRDAALAAAQHTSAALHLSVAAGIRSDSIARWLGSERVVRAMPNTPALVGLGMTGVFARAAVSTDDRTWVEAVVRPTGALEWVAEEPQLDAVTALSGSGPAYVFYFIEAMTEAGVAMGLPASQAQALAVGTFVGAATLARDAGEPPAVLRERVTSKGGTTHAALTHLAQAQVGPQFIEAMQAARRRAHALGDEFGVL